MSVSVIVVTNTSGTKLSLVGDDGSARYDIENVAGSNTLDIDLNVLLGNVLLCSTLSTWVTSGNVTITRGGVTITAAMLTAWEQGSDMSTNEYDLDSDQVVDAAEAISDGTTSLSVAELLAGSTFTQTAVLFAASPYTVLATDSVLLCNSTDGAIAITLPAGVVGKAFKIVDIIGNAATAAITITPDGTETIDGAATLVLGVDNSSVELIFDGSDWFSNVAQVVDNSTNITTNAASAATAASAAVHVASLVMDHTTLTEAGLSETVKMTALPATAVVLGAYLDIDTLFSGGSVSSCKVDVGITSAGAEIISVANVFTGSPTGVVNTPIGTTPMIPFFNGEVEVTVTTVGANVDVLDAGSMTVHVIYIEAAEAIA